MKTNEVLSQQPALQLPIEMQRTVHTPENGVVRTRFVLHPSYRKLGEQIDELNRTRPRLADANDPASEIASSNQPGKIVITRELIITTMVRFPEGVVVRDLCEAALGTVTPELMQRVYSLLARETVRGLVEPDGGRGTPRRLSASGHRAAAEFELAAARQKSQSRHYEKAVKKAQQTRVNGIFDYARKVEMGLINEFGSMFEPLPEQSPGGARPFETARTTAHQKP